MLHSLASFDQLILRETFSQWRELAIVLYIVSGKKNREGGKNICIRLPRLKIDITTSYHDRYEIPTKAGNLTRSPVIRRRNLGNADPSTWEKVRGDAKSRFAVGSTANSPSARRTKARRLRVTFAPTPKRGWRKRDAELAGKLSRKKRRLGTWTGKSRWRPL